jgi:hypothetical protein
MSSRKSRARDRSFWYRGMADPNFERSLRAAARRGRPAGDHPDAAILASYVDRGLTNAERAALEAHVSSCAECMERLALLGSVNSPEESGLSAIDWSPRELLTRWGWLVPVATVVLVVAIWIRQPLSPQSRASAPASPPAGTEAPVPAASTPPSAAADQQTAAQKKADELHDTGRQVTAAKEKDTAAKPQLQAQPFENAAQGQAAAAAREGAYERSRDKKEVDAVRVVPASKVAPAPAPVVIPVAPGQNGATALSAERRADEAKQRNAPLAAAVPPMREEVAKEAFLKSAKEVPLVLATGAGVSVRRIGTRIERSTDNGATWNVDLAAAPATVHVGVCPTATVCWLGGADGTVLVRQPSGAWVHHTVADGKAAILAIEASDSTTATVRLSDGRSFRTANGGATWVESK